MNKRVKLTLTLLTAASIFPISYSLSHAESSSIKLNNTVTNGTIKTEIQTSGNAKATVSTTVNGKNTTVTSAQGSTTVKTTNEKGETTTKTLEDGSEVKIENGSVKVMTENGEKTVSVTTEQAVEAIVNNGTISHESNIKIETSGDNVNYVITGYQDKRFLGVFPIKLTRVVTYSANERTVSSVHRSFLTKVLDRLSF